MVIIEVIVKGGECIILRDFFLPSHTESLQGGRILETPEYDAVQYTMITSSMLNHIFELTIKYECETKLRPLKAS